MMHTHVLCQHGRLQLYITVTLLVISAYLFRPTVFSDWSTIYGLGLLVVTFVFYLLSYHGTRYWTCPVVPRVIVLVSILWTYLLIHAAGCSSRGFDIVIQVFITNCIVVWLFGIILANDRYNKVFFSCLTVFFAVMGLSSIITLILSAFIPLESMHLLSFPVIGYDYREIWYFPLSFHGQYLQSADLVLPRFNGLFREPGIAQAFVCWAICFALYHRLPKWVLVGLTASVVLTFSTAGIALLPMMGVLWVALNKKMRSSARVTLVLTGVILVVVIVFLTPHVGIKEKIESSPGSIKERLRMSVDGLLLLREYPMGIGYWNHLETFREDNAGITLLAQSGKIGLPGFILAVLVYFAPLFTRSVNPRPYMIAVSPILFTSMFAQPLFDLPFQYILLLSNFADSHVASASFEQ
jgi:hypothetical protein